jgi:anti-sigma regulatory factor (Ser/Thr protein kinase)
MSGEDHRGLGEVAVSTAASFDAFSEVPQRGDARSLRVRHRASAVPAARRELLEDLAGRVDADLGSEAAVVVSELLGNAVRHAAPLDGPGAGAAGGVGELHATVLLRWQLRAGTIDIEVTDGGARGEVRPLRPAPYSTNGRGLRIVRSIAHEWGVIDEPDGRRTVWAAVGGPTRRRRRV